jgi:hypothetical protein
VALGAEADSERPRGHPDAAIVSLRGNPQTPTGISAGASNPLKSPPEANQEDRCPSRKGLPLDNLVVVESGWAPPCPTPPAVPDRSDLHRVDAPIAGELDETWQQHLATFEPAIARMYSREHRPLSPRTGAGPNG